jgi:tetratricopeptide (TPR) repeat protein
MKTFAERQALYGKGSEFFAEERFAEALDCFQRLAADIPNNFVTQNFLGMTRLRMGEAAKALVNFSIAEQLAAHSGFSEKMKARWKKQILFNRALCFCQLEDDEKVIFLLLSQMENDIKQMDREIEKEQSPES